MAFTLGSVSVDSTLARGVGTIAAPLVDSTLVRAAQLPALTVDSLLSRGAGKLALPIIGDDGPTATTITPTGGAQVFGVASRSFFLNGTAVTDPALYVITPTGGIAASGTPDITAVSTLQYELVGTGRIAFGSTAPSSVSWSYRPMTGGAQVGGTATVSTGAPTGNGIVASLPVLTAALSAPNTQGATIAASLPVLTATSSGYVAASATMAASLPALTATSAGVATIAGAIQASLPTITTATNAVLGTKGALVASLAVPTASATGYTTVYATIAARLPTPTVAMYVHRTVVGDQLVMVTNLVTKAVTTYEHYPFNSFAQIGDEYYAAGPGGFYKIELEGTVDIEGATQTPIDATVRFGKHDFGSDQMKRVSDSYASMRADGDMQLRVYVDEQEPLDYTVSPLDIATIKQRRSLIGKGARGKYWQIEMQNTDGCAFDLDAIDVVMTETARRV